MMPKKTNTLREWRDKHAGEMDENLRAWKEIRDNPGASDRDKNEAAKNISRALGSLTPDKVTKPSGGFTGGPTTPEPLSPEEELIIGKVVEEINKEK